MSQSSPSIYCTDADTDKLFELFTARGAEGCHKKLANNPRGPQEVLTHTAGKSKLVKDCAFLMLHLSFVPCSPVKTRLCSAATGPSIKEYI